MCMWKKKVKKYWSHFYNISPFTTFVSTMFYIHVGSRNKGVGVKAVYYDDPKGIFNIIENLKREKGRKNL